MDKLIEIRDGALRCRTSEDNVEIASLYFREHRFNAVEAAKALHADDGGATHNVYEWLAVVHEAKSRIDRDLDFRGRR